MPQPNSPLPELPQLLVGFALRGGFYCIDAQLVVEVIRAQELTPIPHAPPAVLGVMNLRGRIVTLLDTGLLLGLEPLPWAPHLRVILLDQKGERFGFVVDLADEVSAGTTGSLLPPPENLPPGIRRVSQGIFRRADSTAVLLSATELLAVSNQLTATHE